MKVVVLVAEEVLAVLTPRTEVCLGDEEAGMDGGSCAGVPEGPGEDDPLNHADGP